MEAATFAKLSELIYRESGIVLTQEKQPLLHNRISKRLETLNIKSGKEYLKIIESDLSGAELVHLVDAISTNVTYFYREPEHFKILRNLLVKLESEKTEIKIWCAAASSGEEPYTIAFEALESLEHSKTRFKILGTDICTTVLENAKHGIYSEKSTNVIHPQIRSRYMRKMVRDDDIFWKVNPEVAEHVFFKKLNLIKHPYPLTGPIDIIFCRNVMIYFDKDTRNKILDDFTRLLSPGGYLFLSHSENILGIENGFNKFGSSVYQKR